MSILLNNKILKATEAQIEANLTPDTRRDYLKIVIAGQRYVMHNGRNGLLASLKDRPDPIRDCVRGAVNIVSFLRRLSRGTMPVQAMVPAAMSLMLQGLDFVDKAGIVAIGRDELVRATRLFIDDICKAAGVTPEKLRQISQATTAVMNDPGRMEMLKRHVGAVRAPNASMPVDIPNDMPPPNRRARRAAARGRR